ncbi:flavin-containing monooxygenase 5-like [Ixodes scapularis]
MLNPPLTPLTDLPPSVPAHLDLHGDLKSSLGQAPPLPVTLVSVELTLRLNTGGRTNRVASRASSLWVADQPRCHQQELEVLDFPPPKEAPNFMHHTKMVAYIRNYADHFGITGKVRLRHEVLRVTQAKDYDSTGRWDVVIKCLNGDVECRETFDAVLVASGHYRFPNVPTFKGQEKFKGRIVHTHSLKVPDQFKDRRVAVVGIGNSGVDAAVDACHVASEVSLICLRADTLY